MALWRNFELSELTRQTTCPDLRESWKRMDHDRWRTSVIS